MDLGWDDLLSIPTLGGYTALKQGGKYLYKKLYQDPAEAKKAALDAASEQAKQLGQEGRDFALQGTQAALAQFAPADATYKALYGDPSSLSVAHAPQQLPPGTPPTAAGRIGLGKPEDLYK